MTAQRKKILLSFPTSPAFPYLHKHVVFASWKLIADRRHDVKPMIPSHSPFENNLHHIILDFLKGGFDYWLSIDFDNPPMANPLDDVDCDLDVIGFPTPVWHYSEKPGERPLYWNGYDYVPDEDAYKEHMPREGMQKVDAIGTGCFLIARRVFEHPDLQKGAFTRQLYDNGTVKKGNDISFSERARAAGFHLFVDYDRPCMHFNQLELNEVVRAFKGLYEDAT